MLVRRIAAASQANASYIQYLATLTQAEANRRLTNRYKQRIKGAWFLCLKELAHFDFTAILKLNKALVLELSQGGIISKKRRPSCWFEHQAQAKPTLLQRLG